MIHLEGLSSNSKFKMIEALLDGSRVSAIVTNPALPDNPIIYANQTFETMTGYTSAEIIGLNCRFLQGEETDQVAVEELRKGIMDKVAVTTILKNYKKDGTLFWNRISIKPLVIEDRLFFTGTQTDVSVEYRQKALLDDKRKEIEQLMFPVLRIQDNLAAVSLIGVMSPDRFDFLTKKLTEFVQDQDVDHVIIDISGLHWSHDSLSLSLITIQDVLSLMGRKLYVTGISPKWAQQIVQTREDHKNFQTFTSIQQAIAFLQ